MELALYEFENAYPRILSYLDVETEDPAIKYCMEQTKHHLKAAHELLEGALLNPQTHYDDAHAFYQTLWKVLPLMVLLQSSESPPPDPVEEGSLPDTQSSDQSDQDTFEPVTPSRRSES